MTEWEHQLWQALRDLEQAAAGAGDLTALFARIDALAGQAPPRTDPTLRHYLAKQSCQKARRFLESRDARNAVGNCRHV